MIIFIRKAIQDILENRFLNIITIFTMALSILIVSTLTLFFVNADDVMNFWKKGLKIMVYLKPDVPKVEVSGIKKKIQAIQGVQEIRFISKADALKQLKEQMKHQASLFENLSKNPLPDAFEIRIISSSQDWNEVERLSNRIKSIPQVDEVEYGQLWLDRFANIYNLFRLTSYAMGGLFFTASVFIAANTSRLVLYSRREEIEIMQLAGATDSFIKAPIYTEGFIQGALGGIIGLGALFIIFLLIASKFKQGIISGFFYIRFIPPGLSFGIIFYSMLMGWLGCHLSLKQFLKR